MLPTSCGGGWICTFLHREGPRAGPLRRADVRGASGALGPPQRPLRPPALEQRHAGPDSGREARAESQGTTVAGRPSPSGGGSGSRSTRTSSRLSITLSRPSRGSNPRRRSRRGRRRGRVLRWVFRSEGWRRGRNRRIRFLRPAGAHRPRPSFPPHRRPPTEAWPLTPRPRSARPCARRGPRSRSCSAPG